MSHISLAHRRAHQAIAFALLTYAFYSTGDALVKVLGQMHSAGIIMTCNGALICLFSLLGLAYKKQTSALWQTPRLKFHLMRSAIVGSLVLLALVALRHVPLPDYYGILFMSPFIVGLIAYFVMGEEIGLHRAIAAIAGFIGVLVLAGPHFTDLNIWYVLVFISLFMVSAHVLVVRKLGTDDPWPLLSFFPGLGMLIVGVPLLVAYPEWPRFEILPLILVYSLCIFFGQICFSKAFTITPLMAIIAPYVYTQMLWGVFYSVVVFDQTPTLTTAIGALIIITSGMGALLYERHLRRRHLLGARAKQKAGHHPPEGSAAAAPSALPPLSH